MYAVITNVFYCGIVFLLYVPSLKVFFYVATQLFSRILEAFVFFDCYCTSLLYY